MEDIAKSQPMDGSMADYSSFLGAFIGSYATLETFAREALRMQSGLSAEKFEVLIGFPRTSDLLERLRKLFRLLVDDPDLLKRQESVYGQLKVLTLLRDRLVHFGGNPLTDGRILVRLKPNERSEETGQSHAFHSSKELWMAAGDLHEVTRFVVEQMMWAFESGKHVKQPEPYEPPPWNYKAPALVTKK